MTSETDLPARLARAEQRLTDLDLRVSTLTPLIAGFAALTERVIALRADLADLRHNLTQRDNDASRERRTFIRWAISLTVTIVLALMSAGALIIASGIH